MHVSPQDRALLQGDFQEPPEDGAWLLRYFPESSHGLVVYYLKMRPLLDEYGPDFFFEACQSHLGQVLTRKSVDASVRLIRGLEEGLAEAQAASDLQRLSDLKLGFATDMIESHRNTHERRNER